LAILYTVLLIRRVWELVEIIVVNPRLETVAPVLALILLFGPLGILLYLIVRSATRKRAPDMPG